MSGESLHRETQLVATLKLHCPTLPCRDARKLKAVKTARSSVEWSATPGGKTLESTSVPGQRLNVVASTTTSTTSVSRMGCLGSSMLPVRGST